MAIEQEKEGGDSLPEQSPASTDGLSPAGASRRRLAGLGASGVLMTLASQSAMAGLVCKSPSGALSGSLASRKSAGVTCAGLSPGYWKNHEESWAGAGVETNEFFRNVLSCRGRHGYTSVRCIDILSHQDYDISNIGMHMMATYLNVASGRISFMSIESVCAMWDEYMRTGAYVPSTGAKPWNAADIVLYLSSTQA